MNNGLRPPFYFAVGGQPADYAELTVMCSALRQTVLDLKPYLFMKKQMDKPVGVCNTATLG